MERKKRESWPLIHRGKGMQAERNVSGQKADIEAAGREGNKVKFQKGKRFYLLLRF